MMTHAFTDVVAVHRKDGEYFLEVSGVELPIDDKAAHAIVLKSLPHDDPKSVVWSVNANVGDFFYDPDYPEWSLKPHPRIFVAGNIYYSRKQEALANLKARMQDYLNRHHEKTIKLEGRIRDIETMLEK